MMSQSNSRGRVWLEKLAPNAPLMNGLCPSVQVADGELNGESVRFIAVVPDANNHYPRAAKGRSGPAGRLDAGESGQRNHRRRRRQP
jgi:malonate decarboxylase gamma subunit